MKITEEWLKDEIERVNKNIDFLNKKAQEDDNDWSLFIQHEEGVRDGLERVLFHKKISNRSCVLFDIHVPMWKRHIIRLLKHFCDWLEGVDDKNIFKRDILERRSDGAHKRYDKYRLKK